MNFARINGVLLHYRVQGPADAPVLVFANSLGTDARIWDDVIARLGDRYRVISYDKRGHGLSDTPTGPYRLEDHIDDLAGLLDHLGIARLALCGVSIGGMIAQGFALRFPERLTAAILCDTAPKIGDDQTWNDRIAAVETDGLASLADAVMARWFSPGFRRDRKEALAGWRNLFLRTDPVGYAGSCAALRDADLSASVGQIRMPVLVMCGAEDGSTPVDLVRACADAIPGARFTLIEDAGHIPSIEQPQVVAQHIAAFLEEVRHG